VGNLAYVVDAARGQVDVWDTTTDHIVQTYGGTFAGEKLNQPKGIAVDPSGNWLYIADSGNQRIVRVSLSDSTNRQLVSTGYDTPEGHFGQPRYLAFDSQGNLYVSDFNQRVYVFSVGP
jgi:DNA-binding beta-propeller fold protein YncE